MDVLINIDVDDLAKAVDFYGKAFGLRIGRRFGDIDSAVRTAVSAGQHGRCPLPYTRGGN